MGDARAGPAHVRDLTCRNTAFFVPNHTPRGQTHTKLRKAVKAGDVETAREILEATDVDLDYRQDGKTILCHAIMRNDHAMVKLLLGYDSDPNICSYVAYNHDHQLISCDEPPLVTAARTKADLEISQTLLKFRANPDSQSSFSVRAQNCLQRDKTALHFACDDTNITLVQLLFDYCAATDLPDRCSELPIHKIVRCRDCEKQSKILKLICEYGTDINHPSKTDCSPLYIATFYGCTRKIETLLKNGADVNRLCSRDNSYGTPLHIAASKDQIAITNLLLAYKAPLNIKNAVDCTPLQLNINCQMKSKVAYILIQHGCSMDGLDKWNYTIMAACINNCRIDCEILACVLISAGYNLNQDVWLDPSYKNNHSRRFNDPERPCVHIPEGRIRKLCDWLQVKRTNASSLFQICRVAVRQVLSKATSGTSIIPRVSRLPLPAVLQNEILLKDVIPPEL